MTSFAAMKEPRMTLPWGMIKPDLPENEKERLESLRELKIIDTEIEESYEQITKLAAEICEVPICLISLVEEDIQWFKSRHGLKAESTPRDISFCAHAILEEESIMEVNDAREDERFFDNPLVTGDENIKFYAGAKLTTPNNLALGTLCVIDNKPRKLTEFQKNALRTLSNQVATLLELRRTMNRLVSAKVRETTLATAVSFGHEINNPLAIAIMITSKLQRENPTPELDQLKTSLERIQDSVKQITDALQSSKIDLEDYFNNSKKLKLGQ